MNLNQLLKIANNFKRIAQGFDIPLNQVFDEQLLSFILTVASGKPKREDINSYIRTNKTMLDKIKQEISWTGRSERDGLYGVNSADHYVLLTKHTNPPKEYKTKSASILKGVGTIPALYLFVMEEEDIEPGDYPKELGHYSFIMQALLEMFPALAKGNWAIYTSNVNDFVEENKSTIDKLRRRFTYEPTFISRGSDGAVFAIGPDRILKIFKDASAYRAAVEAMNRLFKGHSTGKSEAYIDDAGTLGTFYERPVYYYVQELMEPLSNVLEDLDSGGHMQNILDEIKKEFYTNKPILERLRGLVNHPRLSDAIRTIAKRITERLKRNVRVSIGYVEEALGEKVRADWLERLVEEMIVKYATGRTDLHYGNLAIRPNTRTLHFFDPAFLEPTEPPGEGLEYDMIRV